MPNATSPHGELIEITDCYVNVPGFGPITMKSLPDISESKSASYNDEVIMGRSFPLKTFSHSENRSISMQIHFYITEPDDATNNLNALRALESCVYPRTASSGFPFQPPVVCQMRCGSLFANNEICVVLKSYSVKFPTDVAWDSDSFVPYKFDVDTTWDVVYQSTDLPGAEMILTLGG